MADFKKREDQALNCSQEFLNGRMWTAAEVEILRDFAQRGLGKDAIARELGRSARAVMAKASELRVSLRMRNADGSFVRTSGRVLGQPSESWAETDDPAIREYRRGVLSGELDASAIQNTMREERRHAKANRLCVSCGRNYAVSISSGLCMPCFSTTIERLGGVDADGKALLAAQMRHRINYHRRIAADLEGQLTELNSGHE